jgi:hypothetical protein
MRRKQKMNLPRAVSERGKPIILGPLPKGPRSRPFEMGRREHLVTRTANGRASSAGRTKHEPDVYIVQAEGQSLMKIGTASDLGRRIEQLECSSPYRIMCRAWIPAPSKEVAHKAEKAVHAALKKAGRHMPLDTVWKLCALSSLSVTNDICASAPPRRGVLILASGIVGAAQMLRL